MAQGDCAARNRSTGLDSELLAYTIKLLARVPYPALKGVKIILDDLMKSNPKAKGADARTFVESRFLKELEESGFVAKLYGN